MAEKFLREVNAPYLVNPDDETIGRETIIIRRNGEPVAAVLPFAEYQDLLALKPQPAPLPVDPEFEKQWAALQRLMPELLKTHLGQWVGIVNEQRVSSGHSSSEVFDDILQRFGDVAMCVHEILETPRIYRITGPRIIRQKQIAPP